MMLQGLEWSEETVGGDERILLEKWVATNDLGTP